MDLYLGNLKGAKYTRHRNDEVTLEKVNKLTKNSSEKNKKYNAIHVYALYINSETGARRQWLYY